MRYFVTFLLLITFVTFHTVSSHAQSPNLTKTTYIDIGNGLFLEKIPAKYVTRIAKDPNEREAYEWIVIPATYETVEDIIEVSPPHKDIEVTPPLYNQDGETLKTATVKLKYFPPVTKSISRRVMKTPSKIEKRIVPNLYHPQAIRKKIDPAKYIIRNADGELLQHFEDPIDLAKFINAL